MRGSTRPSDDTVETLAQPRPEGHDAPISIGSVIGRYVVLSRIGAGAMGVVFAAYDPELDRKVALKLLRTSSADDPRATARMQREAQSLARLAHPNVVAIHDVGVHGRDVFLAMEFVEGLTLRGWNTQVAERRWSEVLEIFASAGAGLAAAHRESLVHRDFKPDNVMVGLDGRVRVMDFGLARVDRDNYDAENTESIEHTNSELTATGSIVGTPAYMSPEQFRRMNADVRSDQFSFCVALFEALYGLRPFSQKDWDERVEAIRMRSFAPVPQERRVKVPRRLRRAVLRGLSYEPGDRFESMDALLRELEACRPKPHLNRWVVACGVAGVVAAGAWWADARDRCSGAEKRLMDVWDPPRREEVRAAIESLDREYGVAVWERTSRKLDDYAVAWGRAYTEACEATMVRRELSADMMDRRVACLQRARSSLLAVSIVLRDLNATSLPRTHEILDELRPLSVCDDLDALQSGTEPPSAEENDRVREIRRAVDHARVERSAANFDAARSWMERARTAADGVRYAPTLAELAFEDAELARVLARYDDAVAHVEQAMRYFEQIGDWSGLSRSASLMMSLLAGAQKRPEEAERFRELAIRTARDDPKLLALSRVGIANVLMSRGEFSATEALVDDTLIALGSRLPRDDPALLTLQNHRADALSAQGKYAESERAARDRLEQLIELVGPRHPQVASALADVGTRLHRQGAHAQAEAEHRRALEIRRASLGAEHPDTATTLDDLGNVLAALEQFEEAEALQREGLRIRRLHFSEDSQEVATSYNNLVVTTLNAGNVDDAVPYLRKALEIRERILPADHPHLALSRTNLASVLKDLGEYEEAFELASIAWERRARDDIPPIHRATTAWVLGCILWELEPKRRAESVALVERARTECSAAGAMCANRLPEIEAWLVAQGR